MVDVAGVQLGREGVSEHAGEAEHEGSVLHHVLDDHAVAEQMENELRSLALRHMLPGACNEVVYDRIVVHVAFQRTEATVVNNQRLFVVRFETERVPRGLMFRCEAALRCRTIIRRGIFYAFVLHC